MKGPVCNLPKSVKIENERGERELVLYDHENPDAWIQSSTTVADMERAKKP